VSVTGSPFDLSGRRALVTGAANGIGRQAAMSLAGAGAEVICADIDGNGASATAAEIGAAGGTASAAAVDVSDRDQVHDLIGGGPDLNILCNVAGILRHAPVEELTEADLDRVLAVNLKSVLFCGQAAVAGMRRAGNASIINLTSAAIDSIAPNLAAYAMSKAAIAQLTRNMATEWAGQGIRVNAVAPGFVDTAMTAHSYRDPDGRINEQGRAGYLARMREFTPLHIVGEADDIVNAIWFLAADASRYMTGQILRPNGGIAMPW
jgi:3-oxoacyl-[acyl-carrier protein] reductase